MTRADPSAETRTHETVIEIEAAPSAVWRALVDAEALLGWFAEEARVTPGEGGEWWVSHGGDWAAASAIETWEPERHLRVAYRHEERPPAVTDFYVEGRSGGTTVRIVQSGFASDADFESTRRGWAMYAGNLRHYVERHADEPAAQRYLYARLSGSQEDVWERLVGPDGIALDDDARVLDVDRPRSLGLRVPELGDGILRFSVEGDMEAQFLWLQLIAYGDEVGELERAAARWQEFLERVFEPL